MTQSERVVRRCVGGSHAGEEHLCGPATYLHLQHREQPARYERYVVEGAMLHFACEVDEKGMPLTDADREQFGYAPLPKRRGRGK